MHIDLSGKVAVVTGAGRGIGRVIAETFAEEGAVVIATDVRPELLEEMREKTALLPYACDVRDAAVVNQLAADIVEKHGRIDILINNAGVAANGPIETLSEEVWDRSQDINLKGTFLMCRAVIPTMKKQRWGRIINAASFAAIVPSLGSAAYASSKAGVHYFTRVLAGELGPYDVTANCYAPGMIPTELNHFADQSAERQNRLLDTLTLRRWGQAREVAHLLCFLASDYASYITGTMIDVSGGKLATQIPRVAYEKAAEVGDYQWEQE